jgi:hypothetical protein
MSLRGHLTREHGYCSLSQARRHYAYCGRGRADGTTDAARLMAERRGARKYQRIDARLFVLLQKIVVPGDVEGYRWGAVRGI